MKTQEFLTILQQNPHKPLVFVSPSGEVPLGYHLTEVMSTQVHSMDCGGETSSWQQTILQLQDPSCCDSPQHMSAEKFMRIIQRVQKEVVLHPQAEVRFEYGRSGHTSVVYHVQQVLNGDRLEVRWAAPGVGCKPRQHTQLSPALPIGGCCD